MIRWLRRNSGKLALRVTQTLKRVIVQAAQRSWKNIKSQRLSRSESSNRAPSANGSYSTPASARSPVTDGVRDGIEAGFGGEKRQNPYTGEDAQQYDRSFQKAYQAGSQRAKERPESRIAPKSRGMTVDQQARKPDGKWKKMSLEEKAKFRSPVSPVKPRRAGDEWDNNPHVKGYEDGMSNAYGRTKGKSRTFLDPEDQKVYDVQFKRGARHGAKDAQALDEEL
jgi:hypothetical protein